MAFVKLNLLRPPEVHKLYLKGYFTVYGCGRSNSLRKYPLNCNAMKNRERQINLALSEIYAGLSVIRFLAEEYEGKIDTDDLTLFENNVLLAKKYADELAEIARN